MLEGFKGKEDCVINVNQRNGFGAWKGGIIGSMAAYEYPENGNLHTGRKPTNDLSTEEACLNSFNEFHNAFTSLLCNTFASPYAPQSSNH